MKFKILKISFDDCNYYYIVKYSRFGIFWSTVTEHLNIDYYRQRRFPDLKSAEEWVGDRIHSMKKPKFELVCEVEYKNQRTLVRYPESD